MAQQRNRSKPEVRARLRQQTQAQNAAVRRRTQTRQAVARSGRALPPAGGTGGNTNQARDQRRGTARRVQAGQQATVARAWNRVQAGNERQAAIRSELKMTDGRTRYAGPKGEQNLGPRSLPAPRTALPPGRQGGALARRPSSALVAPAQPNTEVNVRGSGVRTGQTGPNRAALPSRGGALARRPSSALTQLRGRVTPSGGDSVRGSGVRTGQPGPERRALPAARSGGGGLQASLRSLGGGAKPGLFSRVALPLAIASQVGDVVEQTRRTGAAWNRMVADNSQTNREDRGRGRSNNQGRGPNIPAPVPGGTGRTADIRGTQRQKPQEGPSRTPNQPTPRRGGQSGPAGGPGPRSGGSGPVASAAPRSTPASRPAAGSSSAASGKSPAEMAATDSWSINFLRARRGLPSLSKSARSESSEVAQGDLGTRAQDERGYTLASIGKQKDDERKRR